MTYKEIGNLGKPKVTAMAVSLVITGKGKTDNLPLAIAIAKKTGKKPTDYLNENIKKWIFDYCPKLDKRIKA